MFKKLKMLLLNYDILFIIRSVLILEIVKYEKLRILECMKFNVFFIWNLKIFYI